VTALPDRRRYHSPDPRPGRIGPDQNRKRRLRERSALSPTERMKDGFTVSERLAAQEYLAQRRAQAATWEPMWQTWMD
jgi:hypothetical protein